MKKRKNIIISAITCMMSICLMMYGVYAATNSSVSINGQVSYTARDASILVQGKMYGADGYETGEYKTVADPTSPTTDDVYASVSQYVDYTSADQNKSTMATWELGELQFYEDSNGVRDVTLSFKFTNLSKYPVAAKVKSVNVTENKDNNITLVPPEKTEIYLQQNTSANNTGEMTFAVKVADDSKDAKLTFSLVLEFTKLEMTTQGWTVDWYDENQDALRIVGYNGTETEKIFIPATLTNPEDGKSYPVKAIGYNINAYSEVTSTTIPVFAPTALTGGKNNNLKAVYVSEGIQKIDALAFTGCAALEDITMPDSVVKIGAGTFGYCSSLTKFQFPSSCTEIGMMAFGGAGLKELTLPSTLQSIGTQAFAECTNLKKVTIEQEDCTKLPCEASIFGTLSSDSTLQIFVKSKDYKTAENWSAYKDYMIVEKNVKVVAEEIIGDWKVQICSDDTANVIRYVGDPTKAKIVVPSTIEYNEKNYHVKRVGLELEDGDSLAGVVNSGDNKYFLFQSMTEDPKVQPSTQYFEFEEGIEEIGVLAFALTFENLQTLVLPQSLKTIGDGAFLNLFSGTINVESLIIPDSVTYMGDMAFFGVKVSKTFKLSSNLKKIANSAFSWSELPETVIIPANVEKIDDQAFSDCGVKNYIFEKGSKLKTIGAGVFGYFDGPTGQIESITIPASVESIGKEAFNFQTYLANITFEGNLSEIPSNCFYGCQSLMSFTVPSGVTKIGNNAFEGCYRLTEIFNLSNLNITAGSSDNGKIAYYAVRVAKNTTSALETVGNYYFIQGDDGYYYLAGAEKKILSGGASHTLPTTSKNYKIKRCALLWGVDPWGGVGSGSVVIPSCVIGIGENAFSASDVTLNCQTPPENLLDLSDCNNIYVPADSVGTYKTAEGWSAYADKIQAIA